MRNSWGLTHKLGQRIGDIVEVEWLDTHSTDRLTHFEIEDLDEPEPTVAYGVVIRNGSDYPTW